MYKQNLRIEYLQTETVDFDALWNAIISNHLLAYGYQKGVPQSLYLGTWFLDFYLKKGFYKRHR